MAISKISIANFRGIAHPIDVDFFSGSSNKPCSLILAGDNGTGKSSVIDAIEFALRGSVGNKYPLLSFAVNDNARVIVHLTNGSKVIRVVNRISEKGYETDRRPHENFNIASFVLRRSDILTFNQTPDAKRQVVFFTFFKGTLKHKFLETTDAEQRSIDQMEQSLEGKWKQRRVLAEQIAKLIGVLPESIPININQFEEFVTLNVYKGISSEQRQQARKQGRKLLPRDIHKAITHYRQISNEASDLKKSIKKIQKKSQIIDTSELQKILSNVGNKLTEAFRLISRQNFVDRIEVVFGAITEVSLSVQVYLTNGKVCSPNQIFSEANLDLLSLLLFLTLLKESANRGQAKLLILDDVFQSVDASIRVSVVDYLMKEFSDWQLILTVHDRLWRNQLREILRRHNHVFIEKEIIRWDFDRGPVILEGKRELESSLLKALGDNDIVSICAQSGILLEAICDRLSWVLPVSVTRKKEDRYTLGDLWPGVAKVLRKTNLKLESEEVERWLHLRNIVGAHFNEWALSLSSQEAQLFGKSVINLYRKVRCLSCYSWIESKVLNNKSLWECKCGQVKISTI
jgi:recombinational DNA repair ATPase RecF